MSENIDERDDIIDELSQEVERLQNKNDQIMSGYGTSNYGRADPNLITVQIDHSDLLEKLERFYRGDVLVHKGNSVVWEKQKNPDLIPLNSFGVNLFMETVSKYVDKNTSLSSYKEERIYEILGDLGDDLVLVVYCNYEKMGMDTPFKKSKFRILITTTLHMIESTYRRSLDGTTSKDINQSRIVSQSDTLGRIQPAPQQHKNKFMSALNPANWKI